MRTEIRNVVKYVCVLVFVSVVQSHPEKNFVITGQSRDMLYMEKGGGKLLEYMILFLVFAFLTKEDSKREK